MLNACEVTNYRSVQLVKSVFISVLSKICNMINARLGIDFVNKIMHLLFVLISLYISNKGNQK